MLRNKEDFSIDRKSLIFSVLSYGKAFSHKINVKVIERHTFYKQCEMLYFSCLIFLLTSVQLSHII